MCGIRLERRRKYEWIAFVKSALIYRCNGTNGIYGWLDNDIEWISCNYNKDFFDSEHDRQDYIFQIYMRTDVNIHQIQYD